MPKSAVKLGYFSNNLPRNFVLKQIDENLLSVTLLAKSMFPLFSLQRRCIKWNKILFFETVSCCDENVARHVHVRECPTCGIVVHKWPRRYTTTIKNQFRLMHDNIGRQITSQFRFFLINVMSEKLYDA